MKFKSLFLLLILATAVSCATPFKKGTIEDFQRNVKKVAIIPVYTSDEFYPKIPTELSPLNIEENLQKGIAPSIASLKTFTDATVKTIFEQGRFKIQTVTVDSKNIPVVKSTDDYTIKGIPWPYNYSYSLAPETVKTIAEKYNVDAVYFQYYQVKKDMISHTVTYNTYVYLPTSYISYEGIIYDKDGSIIFMKTEEDYEHRSVYDSNARLVCTLDKPLKIDERTCRPQPRTVESLNKTLTDEEYISKNLGKTNSWKFVDKYGYLIEIWR